jgi:hypothetical protein
MPPFDAGVVLVYAIHSPSSAGRAGCSQDTSVSQLVTGCFWGDKLSATCKVIGEVNRPCRIPDEIAKAMRPRDKPEALTLQYIGHVA